MSQQDGGRPDDQAMRDRLARLNQDLGTRKQQQAGKAPEEALAGPNSVGSAMSLGFRVMSEFVASVAVGALIGWQGDRWLGTSPLLLILFLVLGAAAGFWTVYRLAARSTGLPGKR